MAPPEKVSPSLRQKTLNKRVIILAASSPALKRRSLLSIILWNMLIKTASRFLGLPFHGYSSKPLQNNGKKLSVLSPDMTRLIASAAYAVVCCTQLWPVDGNRPCCLFSLVWIHPSVFQPFIPAGVSATIKWAAKMQNSRNSTEALH